MEGHVAWTTWNREFCEGLKSLALPRMRKTSLCERYGGVVQMDFGAKISGLWRLENVIRASECTGNRRKWMNYTLVDAQIPIGNSFRASKRFSKNRFSDENLPKINDFLFALVKKSTFSASQNFQDEFFEFFFRSPNFHLRWKAPGFRGNNTRLIW